jgi:hypothetical protein
LKKRKEIMEFIKIPMAFKTKWVLGLGSRGEI